MLIITDNSSKTIIYIEVTTKITKAEKEKRKDVYKITYTCTDITD